MTSKVLFDSDVILDCLLKREPHYVESVKALAKALNKTVKGYIASHSVLNLAYILRKKYRQEEIRQLLGELINYLSISAIDDKVIEKALVSDIKDLEDAVVNYSAELANINCIVTRNISDYKNSSVIAITPTEFNKNY